MYLVRKTNLGQLILSDEEPKVVLNKIFFPGSKFCTKIFERNILSSNYFKFLKKGDWIPWALPTSEQITLDDGRQLKMKNAEIEISIFNSIVKADTRYTDSVVQKITPTFLFRETKNGLLLTSYPVRKHFFYSDESIAQINLTTGLENKIWIPQVEFIFYPFKQIEPITDFNFNCNGIDEIIVYPIFRSFDRIENNYFGEMYDDRIYWGDLMTDNEVLNNLKYFKHEIIKKYNDWYEETGSESIENYIDFLDEMFDGGIEDEIYPEF